MLGFNVFGLLRDSSRQLQATNNYVCVFCRNRQYPRWGCQVCGNCCCIHRRARQCDGSVVCKQCRNQLLTDIRAFLNGD